jgi:hypothetical protein
VDIASDMGAAAGIDLRADLVAQDLVAVDEVAADAGAGVDVAGALATDKDAAGTDGRRASSLRDGAVAGERRLVAGAGGNCRRALVGLEFDEAAGDQFVELLAEMEQQFGGVRVFGLEVSERLELVLEGPQALQVGPRSGVRGVLEVGEDERPVGRLELADRGFELFLGVAADLGEEEHHEDVAGADRAVVLVLQARRRERVEEILPEDQFEKDALADPGLVLAVDEYLELTAIVFEFFGGGEEDLSGEGHAVGSRRVTSAKPYATGW